MTTNETKLLNLTMQYLPLYGEFDFFEKMKMIDNNHVETVMQIYTGTQQLYICDYLVENGFAFRRRDLGTNYTYIQLTSKGRFLKECGTIEDYNEHLKRESDKALKNESFF